MTPIFFFFFLMNKINNKFDPNIRNQVFQKYPSKFVKKKTHFVWNLVIERFVCVCGGMGGGDVCGCGYGCGGVGGCV